MNNTLSISIESDPIGFLSISIESDPIGFRLSEIVENDPRKGLLRSSKEVSAHAFLLPVPREDKIEKQVIKSGVETFKDKSNLSIELLFYGVPSLSQYYSIETILGGGELVVFKGKKRDFASKVNLLSRESFEVFSPLFLKIEHVIAAHNNAN
mgnify:CR=1 FL=1